MHISTATISFLVGALIVIWEGVELFTYYLANGRATLSFATVQDMAIDALYDALFTFLPCIFIFGWWLANNRHCTNIRKLWFALIASTLMIGLPLYYKIVSSVAYTDESWLDDLDNLVGAALTVDHTI